MKYQKFYFFLRQNIYLPIMNFFVQKVPIQNVFDQNIFLFVDRFSNVLPHISKRTILLNCAIKIFHLDLNSCKISVKKHYQTHGNTL